MSDVLTIRPPMRHAPLPRRLESMVGLLFCWGLGFVQLGLLLYGAAAPFVEPEFGPKRWAWLGIITVPLASAMFFVHVSIFASTWQSVGNALPLGVRAALLSPRWPHWMRPLAAGWWTLQFLIGVWMAFMFEAIGYVPPVIHRHAPRQAVYDNRLSPWSLLLLAFGLAFAGNTFLLQAVAVFTRDEAVLQRVWRLRLLIDGGVVLVPAVLAYAGHHL